MKECTGSKGKNKRSNRRGKAEKMDGDVSKKTSFIAGSKATHVA